MSLVINVDTYISIHEMQEYVNKYYTSTDPLRIQWEAMSEADQEVYLRRAFEQINNLPFTGRPLKPNQSLPFPRSNGYNVSDLLKVKYAQAEQSIALTDTVSAQEVEDRLRLRRAGVVSYSIGDLSEEFSISAPCEGVGNFFGLSERAYKYLAKWLAGGYKVCTSIKNPCGRR